MYLLTHVRRDCTMKINTDAICIFFAIKIMKLVQDIL